MDNILLRALVKLWIIEASGVGDIPGSALPAFLTLCSVSPYLHFELTKESLKTQSLAANQKFIDSKFTSINHWH